MKAEKQTRQEEIQRKRNLQSKMDSATVQEEMAKVREQLDKEEEEKKKKMSWPGCASSRRP